MHTTYNNTHNTCKNESKHNEMGPVRKNPIQRTVRSVHNMCASHSAQLLHTILHRTDLIIFPLTLQTIIIAPVMSIWIQLGNKQEWKRGEDGNERRMVGANRLTGWVRHCHDWTSITSEHATVKRRRAYSWTLDTGHWAPPVSADGAPMACCVCT